MNGYRNTETAYSQRDPQKSNKSIWFTLLMLLTVLSGALLLPLIVRNIKLASVYAWAPLLLCALIMLLSVKRPAGAVITVILIIGFFNLTGSPLLPALVLCAFLSPAMLAATVASAEKTAGLLLSLSIFPLSYITAYVLVGDPLLSLGTLVFPLPGLILGLFRRKGGGLTSALICTALPMLITVAGGIALIIFKIYGSLTQETITRAVNAISDYLAVNMLEAYKAVGYAPTRQLELAVRSVADQTINTFPGTLIASCLILAYLANAKSRVLMLRCGKEIDSSSETERMHISLVAAFLYIVSHILSFTTAPDGRYSFLSVVAENIAIVLLPCMLLLGFESLRLLANKGVGGFFAMLGIVIGGIFIVSSYQISLFTFLAFVGAVGIMLLRLDKWAKKYYKKGEHP